MSNHWQGLALKHSTLIPNSKTVDANGKETWQYDTKVVGYWPFYVNEKGRVLEHYHSPHSPQIGQHPEAKELLPTPEAALDYLAKEVQAQREHLEEIREGEVRLYQKALIEFLDTLPAPMPESIVAEESFV